MLKHALVGAVLLATSAAGAAQSKPRPVGSYDAINKHLPTDKKTCVVRKTTGKVECRTDAEWREVAANLQNAAPTR